MQINRTKHLLDQGLTAYGSYAFLKDPASVEVMGYAGLDYVIIDMEHTALDLGDVAAMIRGAEAVGITPIVRVYENSEKLILRALEAGAQGIMIPCIQDAAAARRAVQACRYSPEGIRGTCRLARAARFGALLDRWEEHVQQCNREILVIGLVEDRAGVDALEAIVEEVDVVVIGRGDLSTSLGVAGQVDHPMILELMDRAAVAAVRAGKPVGTLCYSPHDAARWRAKGYRFLQYAIDVQVLYNAYSSWVRAALADDAGRSAATAAVRHANLAVGEAATRIGPL